MKRLFVVMLLALVLVAGCSDKPVVSKEMITQEEMVINKFIHEFNDEKVFVSTIEVKDALLKSSIMENLADTIADKTFADNNYLFVEIIMEYEGEEWYSAQRGEKPNWFI